MNPTPDKNTNITENPQALDDKLLEAAAGGQMDNATEIVYATTFVPFDSSF